MTQRFSAIIRKIGVNPYVGVPVRISRAMKKRGYVPIAGTVNGKSMRTTLVPIGKGKHRLYINGGMRERSDVDVGAKIEIVFQVDLRPRDIPMPKGLADALLKSRIAREAWEQLTPSRQKEILRYLNFAKHQETLDRNIGKVFGMLTSKKPPKKRLAGIRI
jgi:Domain of unknown function (DUF1905)/Bacteriocin-protection, YdeI or OmpD-Associated